MPQFKDVFKSRRETSHFPSWVEYPCLDGWYTRQFQLYICICAVHKLTVQNLVWTEKELWHGAMLAKKDQGMAWEDYNRAYVIWVYTGYIGLYVPYIHSYNVQFMNIFTGIVSPDQNWINIYYKKVDYNLHSLIYIPARVKQDGIED